MGDNNLPKLSFNRDSLLGHPDDKHLYNSMFQNLSPTTLAALNAAAKQPKKEENYLSQLYDKVTHLKDSFTGASQNQNMTYKLNDAQVNFAKLSLLEDEKRQKIKYKPQEDEISHKSEQDKLKDLSLVFQNPIMNQNNNSSQDNKQKEKPGEQRDNSFKIWQASEHALRMDKDLKMRSGASQSAVASDRTSGLLSNISILNNNTQSPIERALKNYQIGKSEGGAENRSNFTILSSPNTIFSTQASPMISIPAQQENHTVEIHSINFGDVSDLEVHHAIFNGSASQPATLIIIDPSETAYVIAEPADFDAIMEEMPDVTESAVNIAMPRSTVTPFPQSAQSVYPKEVPVTINAQPLLEEGVIAQQRNGAQQPQQQIIMQRQGVGAPQSGVVAVAEDRGINPQVAQSRSVNGQNQQAASNGAAMSSARSSSPAFMSVDARSVSPLAGGGNAAMGTMNIGASASRVTSNFNQPLPAEMSGTRASVNMPGSTVTIQALTQAINRSAQLAALFQTNLSASSTMQFPLAPVKPSFVGVNLQGIGASFAMQEVQNPAALATQRGLMQQSVDIGNLQRMTGSRSAEAHELSQPVAMNMKISNREQNALVTASLGGNANAHSGMKDGLPINAQMKTTTAMSVDGVQAQVHITSGPVIADGKMIINLAAQSAAANLQMAGKANATQDHTTVAVQGVQTANVQKTAAATSQAPVTMTEFTQQLTQKLTAVMNTNADGTHMVQMRARMTPTPDASLLPQGAKIMNAAAAGQIANSAVSMVKNTGAVSGGFETGAQVQFANANAQKLQVMIDKSGEVNTAALSRVAAKLAAEKSAVESVKGKDRKRKKSSKIESTEDVAGVEAQTAAEQSNPFDRPDEDSHSFTHHSLSVVAGIIRVSQQEGTAQAGIVAQMGYVGGSTVTTGDEMWQDLSVHLKAQVHASRELRRPTTGDIKIMMGDVSKDTPIFKLAGIPKGSPAMQRALPYMMAPEFNVSRAAQQQHAMAG